MAHLLGSDLRSPQNDLLTRLMQDDIGSRGEALFFVLLTRFYGRNRPLFRPKFLGEKSQSLDFIVELVGTDQLTPFFFVQVKTTAQGYTKRTNRLKVRVSGKDLARLATYPAPTYIVGIDERDERGYILSTRGGRGARIASLCTTHPLNERNLQWLWDEVKDFWDQNDLSFTQSKFTET